MIGPPSPYFFYTKDTKNDDSFSFSHEEHEKQEEYEKYEVDK